MSRIFQLIKQYAGALAVYCAVTLTVLDATLMNVALPTMADVFNVDESATVWIVNIYQLVITMTLLTFASLGDIYGYRRIFKYGVVIFTCASAACAFSTSLETLVIFRAIQGLGAACVMSVNPALLRIIYPENKLGRGLGINAMVVAIATVAGPALCGAILSAWSWNWLFLINIPVGIAAWIIATRHLPSNPESPSRPTKFDKVSAIECALFFGLFVTALDGIGRNVDAWKTIAETIIAFVIGVLFIRRQRGREAPLLPIDLLKKPIFAWSIGSSICSFCAQMSAHVALPFLLQNVMGFDVMEIGILMAPWAIGTIICANIAGRMVEKINGGILGTIGMLVFAGGMALLFSMPDNTCTGGVLWRMLICGMGFGFFQTPNNVLIMTSAPRHRSGGASGMQGAARVLGQTIGTTIVAILFNMTHGDSAARIALIISTAIAILAAIISYQRKVWKETY